MPLFPCPFHDDEHPSVSVSVDKGVFYCFGCGATGNLMDWLMANGLSAKEAFLYASVDVPRHIHKERFCPHNIVELKEFWREAAQHRIKPWGITYMLWRGFLPDVLATWGVDYDSGEVLFRERVVYRPPDDIQDTVSLSRAASAFSRGYRTWISGRPRMVLGIRSFAHRRTIAVYTEGPMDALAVAQVIDWNLVEHNVLIQASGGYPGKNELAPSDLEVGLALPDNDAGGDFWLGKIRRIVPGVIPIAVEEEDPAASGELARKLAPWLPTLEGREPISVAERVRG